MDPGSEIKYDMRKQQDILQYRGLDYNDTPTVFAGKTLPMMDDRKDYGEERIITVGKLTSKVTVIVWTQRGKKRRIISMRYTNERERQRYEQHLV